MYYSRYSADPIALWDTWSGRGQFAYRGGERERERGVAPAARWGMCCRSWWRGYSGEGGCLFEGREVEGWGGYIYHDSYVDGDSSSGLTSER